MVFCGKMIAWIISSNFAGRMASNALNATERRAGKWQKGLIRCSKCKHKASVLAGTIFHGTRKPLRLWFPSYLVSYKSKIRWKTLWVLSAYLDLEVTKRHGAGFIKCVRAMVRPGRDKLHGIVEVDETLVGGEAKGSRQNLHYINRGQHIHYEGGDKVGGNH